MLPKITSVLLFYLTTLQTLHVDESDFPIVLAMNLKKASIVSFSNLITNYLTTCLI